MKDYSEIREAIIDRIEGKVGTLSSVPYHLIDTTDLLKLANVLCEKTFPQGIPEYWEYMNQ